MGAQSSSVASTPTVNDHVKPPANAQHASATAAGSIDQCPHFQQQQKQPPPAAAQQTYPSECPMSGSPGNNSDVNPLNMMPPANQMPAPDQPFPLSTTRVTSNIPKVSEKEENWVYTPCTFAVVVVCNRCRLGLPLAANVLERHVAERLALARRRAQAS